MKLKLDFNLMIKTMLLFPVLTVLQGLPYLNSINRIAIAFLMFQLFFSFKYIQYNIKDLLIIFLTFVIHVIAFFYTEGKFYNFNMVFYLMLWVLIYIILAKKKNDLFRFFDCNKKYAMNIVKIWEFIVIISIPFSRSYQFGAFQSFCDQPFRLMPTTLVILSLIFIYQNKEDDNRYYWYMIVPAFTAFMGFSRTYFAIFIMVFFIHLFYRIKDKRMLFIVGIPIIIVFYFITINSAIGDKFISASYTSNSYFDFWGTITSGRTVFWEIDINAFKGLPLWNRIVGNGYNFVFYVNERSGHGDIWAHNDIINILMNFGYIGVIVYLYAFVRLVMPFFKTNRYRIAKYGFLFMVFFNSMMNMSYTYLCAFISYPIFLVGYAYINGGI